ncbi:TIGR03757 family integrating conjugative element protein [Kushneria indalinina]|uniref:Integrating conjugative element protein (TIGR03757 family) n=1 Tax=Kushneria indalinina DSM 14324 TaxID=1122140 RepID=A0A3D9DRS9_9GAMM|nr:TIGR03757 family integrating conjugative element protein [Kushneria indalinina]REC93371.1 integrating conjugative element protein (TIGR03757 family) [Kushneria indalinina DSM 14324]
MSPACLLRPRAATLFLCLLATATMSHCVLAGVEVFTVAGQPVINVPDSAAVVELDAPGRLDARISQDLPSDPARAKQVLQSRMNGPEWQQTLQRYGQLYQGVARAWMLGVEKVPAVVVDSSYVVYGEPDVARALDAIEQAKGSNP